MTSTNLHRELAPISAAAWAEIDEDARSQFTKTVAARRVVDVPEPKGLDFSSLSTGHRNNTESGVDGVQAQGREVYPVIELKVPFTLKRSEIDDITRGAVDADTDPAREAARKIALAEDRIIVQGSADKRIPGIVPSSPNEAVEIPEDVTDFPKAVAHALSELREQAVEGPYQLLLSEKLYTLIQETTDHGYPVRKHIERVLQNERVLWAPALDGALLISARGGDYELHLGQDLSVGYTSHDAENVELYLFETFTFAVASDEAAVALF